MLGKNNTAYLSMKSMEITLFVNYVVYPLPRPMDRSIAMRKIALPCSLAEEMRECFGYLRSIEQGVSDRCLSTTCLYTVLEPLSYTQILLSH